MAVKATAAPKKAAAPKKEAAPKKAAAPKAASTGKSDGLSQKVQPSDDLAAIIGGEPLARSQAVSKIWEYIRKHDLQNPEDKREILADDKMEKIFGKKKATMFEMSKLMSGHLSKI